MSFNDHVTNMKSDGFNQNKVLGLSRKHPYHPHGGNRKLTPLRMSNTFTIIRNNFFFPPPPDGRNFPCGGSMDLFWNDPL
jgi:hypothetical protein